ncbi:hypothetical protein O4H49_02660 [Kiloniella laminariae]|uniref:Uncharacterized protein n=1 Tax=Kiloniella laminariae TaxID=454162 RepID=A0ABT4LEZ1_9PROT|nr:hypothetical protein [Kiloniella laminariae]MCZ4279663.1 hypothetical protein [Kiloniella laminariae]
MEIIFFGGLAFIGFWLIRGFYRQQRRLKWQAGARIIGSQQFPQTVSRKLQETYPHLQDNEIEQVLDGLRDYFHICHQAGKRMVSMPSQVVDVAWHEFILFTRDYGEFCERAFGRFLHHTPAEAMASPTRAQDGIKRAWRLACELEGLEPKSTKVLPALFALDAVLNIPDGFYYSPDCSGNLTGKSSAAGSSCGGYCATHIGCSSGCGGSTGGCGSGCSSDSGCSSGCGGGD